MTMTRAYIPGGHVYRNPRREDVPPSWSGGSATAAARAS